MVFKRTNTPMWSLGTNRIKLFSGKRGYISTKIIPRKSKVNVREKILIILKFILDFFSLISMSSGRKLETKNWEKSKQHLFVHYTCSCGAYL